MIPPREKIVNDNAEDQDDLENEPDEFIRGEVDVKTQMDRTTRIMEETFERSSGRKSHLKLDTFQKH